MPFLEIACFTPSSASLASQHGAHRIELCATHSQPIGGTTPLASILHTLKSTLPHPIPIHAMLRPRGGSFTYTSAEFAQMQASMRELGAAGADGFVFGVLALREGRVRVDVERCRVLVQMAREMGNGSSGRRMCVFHRAFDEVEVEAMEEELKVLIELGFEGVLTSGGQGGAVEGAEVLEGLVRCAGGRIEVLVGGGVRKENLGSLVRGTGAGWFHSSAVVGGGEEASEEEIRALVEGLI